VQNFNLKFHASFVFVK